MKIKPTRRLFLKGVGGYMLSLPILECMLNDNGNAYAQGGAIKPNYLYTYQGESCGHPKANNFLWKPPAYGNLTNAYNSNKEHDGNVGATALADLGLLNDVNIISNLRINTNTPGAPGNIQVIGASSGGHEPIMHHSSQFCVNSGYGARGGSYRTIDEYRNPGGKHSTDVRLYKAMGNDSKHINYCIEKYNDGSWAQSASMENGVIQTPQKDIGKAFDALFGGFSAPVGSNITVDEAQANRRSILNLVLADHNRLKNKLGYNDRLLVDQHLSSISDLENSIKDMKIEESSSCEVPSKFSENISIDSFRYGGEKERAILFNRLITLAMSCGISRVGNYTILRHKAYVSPLPYVSTKYHAKIKTSTAFDDFHEIGHNYSEDALNIWKEMTYWIGSTYGDLVKRFKEVKVGDGTLLDHSFIMMGMHQGLGQSFENLASLRHVHSFENMSYLQAGGKAFGARTGRHIDGSKRHPVAVANKAAELMGHNITFGEIKDKVDIS